MGQMADGAQLQRVSSDVLVTCLFVLQIQELNSADSYLGLCRSHRSRLLQCPYRLGPPSS